MAESEPIDYTYSKQLTWPMREGALADHKLHSSSNHTGLGTTHRHSDPARIQVMSPMSSHDLNPIRVAVFVNGSQACVIRCCMQLVITKVHSLISHGTPEI